MGKVGWVEEDVGFGIRETLFPVQTHLVSHSVFKTYFAHLKNEVNSPVLGTQ